MYRQSKYVKWRLARETNLSRKKEGRKERTFGYRRGSILARVGGGEARYFEESS